MVGRPGRPVITPGGRYESAVAAARAHGISHSQGHSRAKRQIDGWRFEDEPPRAQRSWAIPVATPAGEFRTVSAAARHHGIACATVEARIRRGEAGWRYVRPRVAVPASFSGSPKQSATPA